MSSIDPSASPAGAPASAAAPPGAATQRAGRAVLVLCAVAAVVALVAVMIVYPGGAPVSRDPGAPAVPWWVVLLPPMAGIALALLLPAPPDGLSVGVSSADGLRASTLCLLALAVIFPVAVTVVGAQGIGYMLAKVLLLVVAAAVVVRALGGVRLRPPCSARRWWGPAAVLLVWTLLSQVAPWVPRADLSGMDPLVLLIGALLTALTAGVGEELFYRRWLQTRLEAWIGPWPGIAAASLAFALMHLASHGTGEIGLDAARVIVAQGSFGLFAGVLWWRFRNLAAVIAAHVMVNGWQVATALLA